MIKKIKKAIFRIKRIMIGKKGVYCSDLGVNNKFAKPIFIEEGAVIGNNNYFGPYVMINNAVIGNFCSIAPGVKIGQGQHSISNVTTYQKISSEVNGHSLNSEPAKLENDIWCGANVVIMQGVVVGNGAVIGANSVVTKDVPPYAIVAGSPARIIRFRFSNDTIDIIQSSNWFNLPLHEAINKVKMLEDYIMEEEI